MAELWEEDEELRRSVPWRALAPGSVSYPKLCSSVAKLMREVADAIEEEAGTAATDSAAGHPTGCIANALAELGEEFVKHRMPPLSTGMGDNEVDSVTLVSPKSFVSVVDPGALALVPLPGADEHSAKLLHFVGNSRRNHMMTHPQLDGPDATGTGLSHDVGDDIGQAVLEEEEAEEENDTDGEEDEEEEDGDEDGDSGQVVSESVANTLRVLCRSSAKEDGPIEKSPASGRPSQVLETVLEQAEVPQSSWNEVCGVLTQLASLGLVRVSSAQPRQSKRKKKAARNRNQ